MPRTSPYPGCFPMQELAACFWNHSWCLSGRQIGDRWCSCESAVKLPIESGDVGPGDLEAKACWNACPRAVGVGQLSPFAIMAQILLQNWFQNPQSSELIPSLSCFKPQDKRTAQQREMLGRILENGYPCAWSCGIIQGDCMTGYGSGHGDKMHMAVLGNDK
ncbi:hypothetical protein WJX77_005290 [Trebouxia sp. C0004]